MIARLIVVVVFACNGKPCSIKIEFPNSPETSDYCFDEQDYDRIIEGSGIASIEKNIGCNFHTYRMPMWT